VTIVQGVKLQDARILTEHQIGKR